MSRIIESCMDCGWMVHVLEGKSYCQRTDDDIPEPLKPIPDFCPLPTVEAKTISALQAGITHALKMASKNVPSVTFNQAYEEWRNQYDK